MDGARAERLNGSRVLQIRKTQSDNRISHVFETQDGRWALQSGNFLAFHLLAMVSYVRGVRSGQVYETCLVKLMHVLFETAEISTISRTLLAKKYNRG